MESETLKGKPMSIKVSLILFPGEGKDGKTKVVL
jgi:hypothetical protein